MGELTPAQAATVRQWLSQNPEAAAEYARIEQSIQALRQFAPVIPQRSLHPQQREAILSNAAPRRSRSGSGVAPVGRALRPVASNVSPGRSQAFRIMGNLAKLAAAACLGIGAFWAGTRYSPLSTAVAVPTNTASTSPAADASPSASQVAQTNAAPSSAPLSPDDAMLQNFESVKFETPVLKWAPQESPVLVSVPEKAAQVAKIASEPPASIPPLVEAPALAMDKPDAAHATSGVKAPASAPAQGPAAVAPQNSLAGFTPSSSHPETAFLFQPHLARPHRTEFAGVMINSAPIPAHAKPTPASRPQDETQPALMIHSWKAEVASCPWDEQRRLMRFVAQIPVEQPALEMNDADYKLVAKFDPALVQGYRLIAEKHLPPANGGTQATRFAWYEIIPTKNFSANANKPATLGQLSIVQPKGSKPRDSSPLKITDRGLNWHEAREDFVFETAMVGFSLLLQGAENTGPLDYNLVLDVAEKTKGEDSKGERTKFIQAVKQAQRAAGL